jgi:hypothetical protein
MANFRKVWVMGDRSMKPHSESLVVCHVPLSRMSTETCDRTIDGNVPMAEPFLWFIQDIRNNG